MPCARGGKRFNVGIVCLLTAAWCAAATAGEIAWRTKSGAEQRAAGAIQTSQDESAIDAVVSLAARPNASRVVMYFNRPITPPTRKMLEQSGVTLLGYLGANAYFARVDANRLDTNAFEDLNVLAGAAPIRTADKLHPFLTGNTPLDWARVGQTQGGDPIVGAYVIFYRDVDLQQIGVPLAAFYGADVRDSLETVNGLVVEMPLSAIVTLGDADEVQWIEPALPRMSEVNNSNRALTQAGNVQGAPYNLDGSGVTALIYDGGTVFASHQDYGGRASVRDGSGQSGHATHVAGTVGGDGSASGGLYTGMAPNVTIESYGFQFDGSGTFLYTNPGDFESDYNEAINTFGADLANNSIGTNTESNGFLCTLQGDYGTMSSTIDAVVRGSLGAPFRIIWANGNERQGTRCNVEGFGDYYSTAPPATAKNHITVGALNSNDDSMTSFSSWGPTDDGRIKPDISAPGCQSNDDGGVTSLGTSSTTSYAVACGTSMAAPTVTGLCALLLEDYRAQFPALADPRNSTMKVLLAHNATDRGNTGPDYQFGYGSVRIQDTIDFMRTGQFTEDQLTQNENVEYTVNVAGGAAELKFTLAWDDFPGTINVRDALVNDLDLVVIDPLGGRHFPWTLDPANPSVAAVRTQEDHTNNIEQVVVDTPMAGAWTVRIFGNAVPEGPQPYSLTSSESLSAASLRITFPAGVPASLTPAGAEMFQVQIVEQGDTLVAGSPALHFRYDGGVFFSQTLTSLGGNLFQARLPAPVCGATPQFYVSAQGLSSGVINSPPDAPTVVFTADIGSDVVAVNDDFETDAGWSVTNTSLSDGPWTRGVPAGGGDRADPPADFDGSGFCWLTDNVAGNSDVDGGPTTLTSPTLDISSLGSATLSVALWMANNSFDADSLTVEFSDDNGGSWTLAEAINNSGGWIVRQYDVGSFVAVNSQFRVRFAATDNPNDSVTEAAVDALRIFERVCTSVLNDCNANGIEDADEIASGLASDANSNGIPDDCDGGGCPDADGDGVCDPNDVCPGFDDNIDTDGDGVPDGCDVCPGGDDNIDVNGNGIPDACECSADVNADGNVDLADLAIVLSQFGQTGASLAADTDNDGDVDLSDLAAVLGQFGTTCTP